MVVLHTPERKYPKEIVTCLIPAFFNSTSPPSPAVNETTHNTSVPKIRSIFAPRPSSLSSFLSSSGKTAHPHVPHAFAYPFSDDEMKLAHDQGIAFCQTRRSPLPLPSMQSSFKILRTALRHAHDVSRKTRVKIR
jgi:hypothetical protein